MWAVVVTFNIILPTTRLPFTAECVPYLCLWIDWTVFLSISTMVFQCCMVWHQSIPGMVLEVCMLYVVMSNSPLCSSSTAANHPQHPAQCPPLTMFSRDGLGSYLSQPFICHTGHVIWRDMNLKSGISKTSSLMTESKMCLWWKHWFSDYSEYCEQGRSGIYSPSDPQFQSWRIWLVWQGTIW